MTGAAASHLTCAVLTPEEGPGKAVETGSLGLSGELRLSTARWALRAHNSKKTGRCSLCL